MPKQPNRTIFVAITKVNEKDRTVTGIAMQEIVDRSNEKCLYEKSKPFFQAWSSAQEKASGGKSKGNVREMHTSSAVGIVQELICDDAQKAFIVTSEIVDDDAWKKVLKGVYTGYSIGANFAEKPKLVDDVLEWVADPVELSIVDVPCVQTATFDLTKADGTVEVRKFTSTRVKSMYTVQQMAGALADIRYVLEDLSWEAEYENDGSKIPARLRDWLASGAEIFLDLTEEETSEFAANITAQKAAHAAVVKGAGCGCSCSGCSECTKKKAAVINPNTETETMTPEQQKAFNDGIEQMKTATASLTTATTALTAATEKFATLETAVTKNTEAVTALDGRVKAIEEANTEFADAMKAFGDLPEAAKTAHPAVAVERGKDTGSQEKSVLPADGADLTNKKADRLSAFKAIHAGE